MPLNDNQIQKDFLELLKEYQGLQLFHYEKNWMF